MARREFRKRPEVKPRPAAASAPVTGKIIRPSEWTLPATQAQGWGWLPALSAVGAIGFLLVAFANVDSRNGLGNPTLLFWLGLLVMYVPIALRQFARDMSRQERIGLIVLLGLGLYLVKVVHSPYAFTFPDELIHFYNANHVLETHQLFFENALLPITPLYPGLPSVTAALVSLSGLSTFEAGIVVIGAARLIFLFALFLFYEQVSRSSRIAGIASVVYMANPNFLFWSAQFAYESLALPLMAMILFVAARRQNAVGRQKLGLTLIALFPITAVVVTHHLTGYALVAAMLGVSAVSIITTRGKQRGPWDLALITLVLTLGWFLYVSIPTIKYLQPTLLGAANGMLKLLTGRSAGRELYRASSGYVAPLWERAVGFGSVLFILAGLGIGLRQVWYKFRDNPFVIALGLGSLVYFPMLALRFTPAGWETSNRSSEFLFVAISLVVALGLVSFQSERRLALLLKRLPRRFALMILQMPRRFAFMFPVLFLVFLAVVFTGGITAGWQPNIRLGRPYLVAAGGEPLEPEGVSAAEWMRSFLGTQNRIAADKSNARLMLAYGEQYAMTNEQGGLKTMLTARAIDNGILDILRTLKAPYALVDRRPGSWDPLVGIYFDRTWDEATQADVAIRHYNPAVYGKFDHRKDVSRIFDSGNILIYDVGALAGVQSATTAPQAREQEAPSAPDLAEPQVYVGAAKPGSTAIGIGGLVLNPALWGLQAPALLLLFSVLVVGTVAVIVTGIVILLRRERMPLEVRRLSSITALRNLLLVMVAGLILATGLVVARTPAFPRGLQGYTQLWMLPSDGADPNTVRLGITSMEFDAQSYRVEINVNGQLVNELPNIVLSTGQEWEGTIKVPPVQSEPEKVEAFLYRADQPDQVYRQVILWQGEANQ